ncbi:NAD-dependent epimerase/dehydratase family protein [Rhodobacter lacus]|uniref:NAD-dependent epimerase/dehydratase family protein n=1 Tax=Rhodobacter lacus TaxID=1641972 RepID=A0ABW5A8L7_9RHOB
MRKDLQISPPATPRLLVVGGSGRLGRLLRRAWPLAGAGVRPLWQARSPEAFAGLGGPDLVFDPLRDAEAFAAAVSGVDAVLMLAAPVAGDAAHLATTTDLARAALRAAAGRPLVLASSAAVYGLAQGLCREDAPVAPVSDYGRAKVEMEAAVASAPGVVVVRIGNVAGADALLGHPAAAARTLHVFEDGRAPRRSYIGPQALVRALARLVRLATAGADLPEVINLALPGTVGMEALLEADDQPWQAEPAPATAIAQVELDVARAQRLGLVPEEGATARRIVADWRELETLRARQSDAGQAEG